MYLRMYVLGDLGEFSRSHTAMHTYIHTYISTLTNSRTHTCRYDQVSEFVEVCLVCMYMCRSVAVCVYRELHYRAFRYAPFVLT